MNSLNPRALVVDDEAVIACSIEDQLADRGYEVTVVTSRDQLTPQLTATPFRIVVTDSDLATHDEMRGWAAEQIIICSGKPRSDLEQLFPGRPLLGKPFSETDLDALL